MKRRALFILPLILGPVILGLALGSLDPENSMPTSVQAQSPKVKIMPLGNSITCGWHEGECRPDDCGYRYRLHELLTEDYDIDFVGTLTNGIGDLDHEGHVGAPTDYISRTVYTWLDDLYHDPVEGDLSPDIVLLHIGTNDIYFQKQDPDEIRSEVEGILNEIDRFETDKNKEITVILALIIDQVPNSPETTELNNLVEQMAKDRVAYERDRIIVVDMEHALDPNAHYSDRLHPNQAGYEEMANRWYPAVVSYFAGKIVVTHDEWTLSNDRSIYQPWTTTDAAQFARNVAQWFMGGTSASGRFLVYSTPFAQNTGLTGDQLESTMTTAGHTWTVISTTPPVPLSLFDLLQYDGIFLAGSQWDNFEDPPPVVPPKTQVLIDYVKAGGNVYLAGGTDPDLPQQEAEQWNPFLRACGLEFLEVDYQNKVDGILKFSSSHPIFAGVQRLFQRDGNSIRKVTPSDPNGNAAILVQSQQGDGLYAVCSIGGLIDKVPTDIDLLSFTAEAGADHVTLAWETGTEMDNAGFNLHRATAADGPYTKINEALIPTEGDPVSGASYTHTDNDVIKGVTYYYKLEDVDIHGVSAFHGPVSATPGRNHLVYLPLVVK